MSNCRLVALQGAAFRFQCRIDALVDGGLALAQASVLTALRLVVGLSRLQLGAHLLDLSHERCNGVMRGIAFNAQRLPFLGRELTASTRSASRSDEPTSELQSQIRISYTVYCL